MFAGLSSNVVPMYLGEITPRNLRGAIGIIPQVFITFGILAAQVFGIRSCLGNKTGAHKSKLMFAAALFLTLSLQMKPDRVPIQAGPSCSA